MAKLFSLLFDKHTWAILSILLTALAQIFPHAADLSGLAGQAKTAAETADPHLMQAALAAGGVALVGQVTKHFSTPNGANGDS